VNKALERARLLEERKRYREHLEQEVQERTRELRETNDRLVEYQALLQEKNQFLEALVEGMPNPVFYKTLEGTYIDCNRAFSRLTGRSTENIVGRSVHEVLPQELACLVDEATGRFPSPEEDDGAGYSCMIGMRDAEGEDRVLVLYKSYFRDRTGQRAGVVGTFLDVTELKHKEAQILHQATHDELTGLPNRMGGRPCPRWRAGNAAGGAVPGHGQFQDRQRQPGPCRGRRTAARRGRTPGGHGPPARHGGASWRRRVRDAAAPVS
jgi:PAS domain S-box-containing protein